MKKQEIIKLGLIFGLNNTQIEKVIIKITDLSKNQLFLIDEIDNKYFDEINNLFRKFKDGEPFEYLINNTEFYGLDFYVDNRVLIPRNDTEVMVYSVLEELKNLKEEFILIDVGTGSCCIPISIIKNISENKFLKNVFALDISSEALKIAKVNIKSHNLENKIIALKSDLLDVPLSALQADRGIEGEFLENIIITANLPYIKDKDYENMDYGVINYEPELALYGGKDTGFEMYEKLINQCFKLKKLYKLEKIILFIEIGFDQYEYSKKYLENLKLKFEFFKDNSMIFRCIKIIFN